MFTQIARFLVGAAQWPLPLRAAACSAMLLLVGTIDYRTGTQVSVAVVYLLPIIAATWTISTRFGLFFAIGAAATWLTVDRLDGTAYSHPLIQVWNAIGLFLSFTLVVLLLSALREAYEHMEDQVRQRTAELFRSQERLEQSLTELRRSHAELKATQGQLIQAAKMESVGLLAAGVAHEVKNPLATILMGLDFLETQPWATGDPAHGVLVDQRDAVNRASAVITELLEFARPGELRREPANLNAILERAVDLVKHDLSRHRVTVLRELDSQLPVLALDARGMTQVFVNALVNAVHAMPQGGTLTIRTYAVARDADRLVCVEIDDTGGGIAEQHLTRLFDPFFTTKPPGRGTGLGLSVVRRIVELHGGVVELTNRPAGGARFAVLFIQKGAEQYGNENSGDRRRAERDAHDQAQSRGDRELRGAYGERCARGPSRGAGVSAECGVTGRDDA